MQVIETTVKKVQIIPNGDPHAIYSAAVVDPSGARITIKAPALRTDAGAKAANHVTIKLANAAEARSFAEVLRCIAEKLQQEEDAALMRGDQAVREVAEMVSQTT